MFKKLIFLKRFKNQLKKVFKLNLEINTNSDKDIFIHNDQNLLKVSSFIIMSSSFIFLLFLAFAKTEEIIVVSGKIIKLDRGNIGISFGSFFSDIIDFSKIIMKFQ